MIYQGKTEIKPEDVGQSGTKIILGRHSGKHAVYDRLQKLGFKSIIDKDKDSMELIYQRFKDLAITKKEINDEENCFFISRPGFTGSWNGERFIR